MKKLSFIFIAAFLTHLLYSQENKVLNYANNKVHIEYTIKDGLLNGAYKSYYPNGNTKAEGTFVNNQKQGLWTAYDNNGKKKIERQYLNSMNFKTVKAWDENGKEISSVASLSTVIDSTKGFAPYSTIKEGDVLFSIRFWREITDVEKINTPLFENNYLYILLSRATISKGIKAYTDDEFTQIIASDSLKKFQPANVMVFRLKEDYFYNKTTKAGEYRIIGISVVIEDANKKLHSFWFYYPEIRAMLAKIKTNLYYPSSVKNIENIFYQRYFASNIIKESNATNKPISDYMKTSADIHKESQRIEMETIDSEYEYWFQDNPVYNIGQ
jgi:hypothetical protein